MWVHFERRWFEGRLDQRLMAHLAARAEVQQSFELADSANLNSVAATSAAGSVTTVDSEPARQLGRRPAIHTVETRAQQASRGIDHLRAIIERQCRDRGKRVELACP